MLSRSAGILLPISALPSKGGIGTLGRCAFEFAERLAEAGQTYWQVLPMGPAGEGNSPYQPTSAFAGSELYIDTERLCHDGLLRDCELPDGETRFVNYAAVLRQRDSVLRLAFSRFTPDAEYKRFCTENAFWLDAFACFSAVRRHYGGKRLAEWEEADRSLSDGVRERYCDRYRDEIEYTKFRQYRFFGDWQNLRRHLSKLGVKLIGDMPIYVSPDGADLWMIPEQFELDARYDPVNVAGVPPDAFSTDGQRWNNPLYRWDVMADDGFSWWRRRVKFASSMYDAIRLDHFIGLARYWSIPAKADSAADGRWRRGPGRRLTDVIDSERGDTDIIAENLGEFHPSAERLLKYGGYPGMKIVQFSFGENDRPYELNENTVIYGGTHDNDTLSGWASSLSADDKRRLLDYLGLKSAVGLKDGLIRYAYSSPCVLAVFQMQDILWLGSSARMNVPGTSAGNWRWRMREGLFDAETVSRLKHLSRLYGRCK